MISWWIGIILFFIGVITGVFLIALLTGNNK